MGELKRRPSSENEASKEVASKGGVTKVVRGGAGRPWGMARGRRSKKRSFQWWPVGPLVLLVSILQNRKPLFPVDGAGRIRHQLTIGGVPILGSGTLASHEDPAGTTVPAF